MRQLRKAYALVAAFLWATCTWAATSVVATPGTVDLYDGTARVGQYSTLAACEAAARARSQTAQRSRDFGCRTIWRVAVTYTTDPVTPPPVVPPVTPDGPTISLSPAIYGQGGYSTIVWGKCTAPAVKTSVPAYAVWDTTAGATGGRSVGPDVTTRFTLTCANGSVTAELVVTGQPPVTPPPTGGGPTSPPPATNLPVPDVLATPIALPVRQLAATDSVRNFAETARRNWSHGGHAVPDPFERGQGYWSYETCSQDYAIWLFDRPTAWFKYFELTGEAWARELAISDFRYYASHISSAGFFECKAGEQDSKYLNVRPFLLFERATGDQSFRPVAARLYAQSAQGFNAAPPSGGGLWTEREVGIHGDAALAYYELTGNTQALARAAQLVAHWTSMAGTVGAPQVTYTQHEGGGPGGSQPTSLTNSPWMSAIYFQFARNYWQITGDQQVLRQVSAYFDWLDANGLYDGRLFHQEYAGVTVPRYLTGELIGDAGYDEGNMHHCLGVRGLVAFAVDAKRRLNLPTARAEARRTELDGCVARHQQNWTRTATQFPRYRIQNPRFWNLWSAGLYESAR